MPTPHIYSNTAADPASARTLPAAAYHDDTVFQNEMTHVLKAQWLPVARLSEIARPGDYRTTSIAGEVLIVSRDADDAVHVLSGLCRHRAMPVAGGSGNAKSFTCPYHLWRYGLDGKFLSAPAMQNSKVFDPAQCNLPEIRFETWNGWVFANLSGTAPPLTPQLGPLAQRLDRLAVSPADLVTIGHLEFPSPWNWKVMVENFLESYHHIGTHKDSLQQTNPGLGTYAADLDGPFALLENPAKPGAGDAFIAACVFPLAMFFFSEGALPTGGWYEFRNLEKDRFTLRIHLFLPPELATDAGLVELVTENLRTIHMEDIPFCEGVQKGLQSSNYTPGPLSHLEACNWHFHRYLQSRFDQAGV